MDLFQKMTNVLLNNLTVLNKQDYNVQYARQTFYQVKMETVFNKLSVVNNKIMINA